MNDNSPKATSVFGSDRGNRESPFGKESCCNQNSCSSFDLEYLFSHQMPLYSGGGTTKVPSPMRTPESNAESAPGNHDELLCDNDLSRCNSNHQHSHDEVSETVDGFVMSNKDYPKSPLYDLDGDPDGDPDDDPGSDQVSSLSSDNDGFLMNNNDNPKSPRCGLDGDPEEDPDGDPDDDPGNDHGSSFSSDNGEFFMNNNDNPKLSRCDLDGDHDGYPGGDSADGDSADGDSADGDSADGDSADGDSADGDSNGDPEGDPEGDPDGDPDNDSGSDQGSSLSSDNEDPDSDQDGGEEAASSDSSNENFLLNDGVLDAVLVTIRQCTVKEALLLVIALAVRHKYSYESLLGVFRVLNITFGENYFPTSKKKMWRILGTSTSNFEKHAYCGKCYASIGLLKLLPNQYRCECGDQISRSKAKYFITLSLKSQLKSFLRLPGVYQQMQFRLTRLKQGDNAIEDIFDGTGFKNVQQKVHLTPSDFSYLVNTDGFSLSKTSKLCAWPLFIRLNEMPPNRRQKAIFLAGLWVDYKEPNMNMFFEKFIDQANDLSGRGILWRPNGFAHDIRSRFFPTCNCVDAKARAPALNMTLFNGYYGCTFCEHTGVYLRGSMKYPLPGSVIFVRNPDGEDDEVPVVVAEAAIRTDESIRAGMVSATEDSPVKGIKGPSELMNLLYFDLGSGFSTDDLHNLFEGVTKFHTSLLLDKAGQEYSIGTPENLSIINSRLLSIKAPSKISRKPRPVTTRKEWTGTEWRNWLLFYLIVCLNGIIDPKYLRHFALLVNAVFLLSRDVITERNLRDAEQCLQRYVELFQEYFGPESMRYNVHLLCHVVPCVRMWGPLWAHSTSVFESRNRRLLNMVKSPKHAIDQIVRRYFFSNHMNFIALDDSVLEEVKDNISSILNGYARAKFMKVGNVYFFGNGVRRCPTAIERTLLAGRVCNHLVQYEKALYNNIECRSDLYNEEAKSDDRHVYTWDNFFCSIVSIVVLEDGENETCGLFVDVYDVGDPTMQVSHIVSCTGNVERRFIPLETVRNLAIKVSVAEASYIMPMPNQVELD